MIDDPILLLGAAQPDKEQARSRGCDSLHHSLVFLGSQGAEGRALDKRELQIWMLNAHRGEQCIERGPASAV